MVQGHKYSDRIRWKMIFVVTSKYTILQTTYNTVYAVRADALTQMLGYASHFAYTDTVKRNRELG